MRALVVYESMFGNTEQVAQAISEGLASHTEVQVVEVSSAPEAVSEEVALLVAGGPTHAFGMSRPATRQDASERAARADQHVLSSGPGLREWLEALAPAPGEVAAAAFDTHIGKPRLPGSAAKGAHRRLRRLGFHPIAEAVSFYVEDTAGPLEPGELQRARTWGEHLGAQVRLRPTGPQR